MQLTSELDIDQHKQLFSQLSSNLRKNQHQLRLQTLLTLSKFKLLEYQQPEQQEDEEMQISEHYAGKKCDIIHLMLQFEQINIAFETEKTKILLIKKIQTILQSGMVPDIYVEVALNFLMGIFWIKFTPLFESAQEAIASIIKLNVSKYSLVLLNLIENVGYLTQLSHDNDEFMLLILNKLINVNQGNNHDLIIQTFQKESRLQDPFMETKDLNYNLVKSLSRCLEDIFEETSAKTKLFEIFYSFIDNEYKLIYQTRQNQRKDNLLDQMTYANMLDSETFMKFRRQTYAKLYCFLELFNSAESLKNIPRLSDFQQLMNRLINTNDTRLQKLSLECLIKTDYKGGILRHYRKLLEGFTDDEKFKDMVQTLNFGTAGGATGDRADNEEFDAPKKSEKGVIPKLAECHRLDVLPIVIKLLLSKLLKKKGSINKKTVYTRRNIVYNFMSTLKPGKELDLFFNEMLEPFDIQINDDLNQLDQKLSQVSFSGFLNFINSLSVIIKQLGSLLTNYLPQISSVLLVIMKLTKMFIKQMKLSLVEDQNEEEEEPVKKMEDGIETKDSLYKFVGRQSKLCMRKSFGVVKQLYAKFSHNQQFMKDFSQMFFKDIVEDQLPLLTQNYITDKSQLMEILTIQWSSSLTTLDNFINFQGLMPSLMKMLSMPKITPEVYELLFSMLRGIILKSIQGLEEKKNLKYMRRNRKQKDDEDEELEEVEDQEVIEAERNISQQILKQYIQDIAINIHGFTQNNLSQLKNALIFKGKQKKTANKLMALGGKQQVHETKQQSLKDLIFIISEITNYLEDGAELNQAFLDMTVQILSLKTLHQSSPSSHHDTDTFHEDLLLNSCKSLTLLLTKTSQPPSNDLLDKLFQLFLTLKSLKVRQTLSQGLYDSLQGEKMKEINGLVREEVRTLIVNMNKIKRGLADVEIDYDLAIKSIEKIGEVQKKDFTLYELRAITFSILFHLQSQEFSVRDYSSHFLKQLFSYLETEQQISQYLPLITLMEQTLLSYLRTTHDDLILKTLLDTLRGFIQMIAKLPDYSSPNNLSNLTVLIQQNTSADLAEPDDFFSRFCSIKLKTRAKGLQQVVSALDNKTLNNHRAIQAVIVPLVNYVIFGAKYHKQNRRGTVSYIKQEKRVVLDEALNIYESLAKQLKWSDYYKLLKQLLYKLNKTTNKINYNSLSGGNKGEDGEQETERIVTKCICKVLNGFHFEEVPDAIEKLENARTSQDDEEDQDQDFEEVIKKVLLADSNTQQTSLQQQEQEIDEDEESVDDEEEDREKDKVMQSSTNIQQDIQDKLYHKVLPILERHMTDYEDLEDNNLDTKKNEAGMASGYGQVRSFVVLSITRIIRKLPVDSFQNQLQKLINNIVSKGLRSRQLVHREKARKSLVKLLIEVSPRFLYTAFSLMDDLLTKGYQLQTYVFTILFILQQLQEKKVLKTGQITQKLIDLTADKLMTDLFGELKTDDRSNMVEDQQKNKIKEAKGKKAIPIFELYAQFIDFKKNFFVLLGPIIRNLEGNPSIGKIQQCEELLNRMSSAIIKNESVRGDQLLMFLYSIIEKGVNLAAKIKINDEKATRDYGGKTLKSEMFIKTKDEYKEMTYKVEMKWKKGNQLLSSKKVEELSGRVLASFGLMCLKKSLKNKGLILSNAEVPQPKDSFLEEDLQKPTSEQIKDELKAKLDPFVPVLLNAFKTYHNPIVVSTLHVLGMIINLGLPSFKQLMKKFLNRIFKLFEQTSASNSAQDADFINSLFKCTAELIKNYSTFNDLSELQLKTLLDIIKQNLNGSGSNNPNQINVFHLLRALVYRKFVSPYLYDIIDQNIQGLVITSLSPAIRSLCGAILLNFLLEYPMEQFRLSQHLNYLLKNVGTYFDSDGRLSILELMEKICEKLPREVMDQESEKWTFTLMLRCVNEKNKKCKEKVSQVLKKLLIKISPSKAKTIYNTLVSMTSDNPQKRQVLFHAKLLVLGLLIDAVPSLLKNNNDLLNVCYDVISEESQRLQQEYLMKKKQKDVTDDTSDDEIQNPEFKRFLQNIELLDKDEETNQKMDMIDDESEDKDIWSPLYYAIENITKMVDKTETNKQTVSWVQKQNEFLPKILQLNQNHQVYWIRLIIHRLLNSLTPTLAQTFTHLKDKKLMIKTTYTILSSFKFLPMTKELGGLIVKNSLAFIKQGAHQGLETDDIVSFYKKTSFNGRKIMLNISQAVDRLEQILTFFVESLTLFEQLENNEKDNRFSRAVCEPILELVYRIYTDDQYAMTSAPKTLSYQLVDYFSTNLDKPYFLNIYNNVKNSIAQKRLERKRQQKVMMISDSAKWEKIKEKERTKKREKKKEKKREQKMMMALMKT